MSVLVGRYAQNLVRSVHLLLKAPFAGCLGFDMAMDIRYSARYKINIFDRQIELVLFSPIKYQR